MASPLNPFTTLAIGCSIVDVQGRLSIVKPTVFVHTNHKQLVGALVSAYSLRRNSRHAEQFDVRILHHRDFPFFQAREGQQFLRGGSHRIWRNDDLQSFTPLRFAPPEVMGYQGRAVVIDPDVFAVGDIYELLSLNMRGKALMCVARPGYNDRPDYLASSVMLLDCAQLRDWRCKAQFHEMFDDKRDYLEWIYLGLEPRERIGLLALEWNHFDTFNENTRLLHNTKRQTQPWKTGLPRDYTVRAKGWRSHVKQTVKRVGDWLSSATGNANVYTPHPDPRQEAFFFGLLRECLEHGFVTEELLKDEMHQDHLRHDTLELLKRTPALAAA